MLASLNKKADYTLLDKLNETISKKVDNDMLRAGLNQNKTEL